MLKGSNRKVKQSYRDAVPIGHDKPIRTKEKFSTFSNFNIEIY